MMITLKCLDKTFENIQAIIFDKDGTLANVESYLIQLAQKRSRLVDAQVPGVQEPLLMAFGVEGNRINPMGLQAVGSRQENLIAAAAYIAETGRAWAEALQIATTAFQEADTYLPNKASQTPLFSGIQDWLTHFADRGLKLGILSADITPNVQQFMTTYNLNSIVQAGLGSSTTLSKPQPEFYQALCQELAVIPAQTLMIGDSTLDMAMANTAGAAGCIGVTWGWQYPVAIADATVLINTPNEFKLI